MNLSIETREGHHPVRCYQRFAVESLITADNSDEALVLDGFNRGGIYGHLLSDHGHVVLMGNPVHTVDAKNATDPALTLNTIEAVLQNAGHRKA